MQKTSTNAALAGAQENISVPEAGQERSGFGSSNFLFVSAALLGVRAWRTALKVFDLAVDYALPLILRGLSVGVLLLPRIVFSAGFNAAKVVAFARHFKNKEKRSESIQKISERWKRMRDSVFSWKWYEHKIHDGVAWAIPRVYNGMKKRGPYASLAIVSLATVFGVPLCIAGWGLSHAFGFWLMFQGTGIWSTIGLTALSAIPHLAAVLCMKAKFLVAPIVYVALPQLKKTIFGKIFHPIYRDFSQRSFWKEATQQFKVADAALMQREHRLAKRLQIIHRRHFGKRWFYRNRHALGLGAAVAFTVLLAATPAAAGFAALTAIPPLWKMAARQRQALTGKFIRANDAYQRWAARLAKRRPWLGLPALKLGMTAEVIATSIYTNFNKAVADFEKPPSQRLREMARNFYESFRESLPKKTKAAPETTAAMVREELIDMTKHHPAKTMGAVSASLIYGSGTLLPVLAAWSYATTSGYVGQAAAWSGLTSVTLWHTAVGAATASFYGVLLGTLGMAALTSLAAYGIYKLASSGDFFQLAAGQLTKPYKASERYKDGVFNAMIEGFSMATLVGMVGKFTHAGASTKLGVEAAGVVPAVNKAASDIGSEFARVGMIWGDRARRVRNFLRRTPAVSHDI